MLPPQFLLFSFRNFLASARHIIPARHKLLPRGRFPPVGPILPHLPDARPSLAFRLGRLPFTRRDIILPARTVVLIFPPAPASIILMLLPFPVAIILILPPLSVPAVIVSLPVPEIPPVRRRSPSLHSPGIAALVVLPTIIPARTIRLPLSVKFFFHGIFHLFHNLIPPCDYLGAVRYTKIAITVYNIFGVHTASSGFIFPFVAKTVETCINRI